MKPTIVSISLTFVKDQFSDGAVIEAMAILSNGEIVQKTYPVDGRIIRLDYDLLTDPVVTVEKAEEDGA